MADVAGNPKVRSQLITGIVVGIVVGIDMAVLKETRIHAEFCRPVNANIADYLVPVNADVPNIETIAVEAPNCMVGVTAAIANAVYRATGTRVRELPVPIDKRFV